MKKFLLVSLLLAVSVTTLGCSNTNQTDDFVATTQSVKAPAETKITDCVVSVYPSNSVAILESFEISIDPVIEGATFEVTVSEKNPQGTKKGVTTFNKQPITIERTILEAGTYTISYNLESNTGEKSQCDTTITVG